MNYVIDDSVKEANYKTFTVFGAFIIRVAAAVLFMFLTFCVKLGKKVF